MGKDAEPSKRILKWEDTHFFLNEHGLRCPLVLFPRVMMAVVHILLFPSLPTSAPKIPEWAGLSRSKWVLLTFTHFVGDQSSERYPSHGSGEKWGIFPFQEPQVDVVGELCLQVGVQSGHSTTTAAQARNRTEARSLEASLLVPASQEKPWAQLSLPLFLVRP